jgi:hypothetical protein
VPPLRLAVLCKLAAEMHNHNRCGFNQSWLMVTCGSKQFEAIVRIGPTPDAAKCLNVRQLLLNKSECNDDCFVRDLIISPDNSARPHYLTFIIMKFVGNLK